jgi:polyisoprenoid-binding protein YceI
MTSTNEIAHDPSAFSGSWKLDPNHTSITFHTKALWVLKVKGTFKAIEGSGTIGTDGSITGSIVLDAASVDTNNKKRDDHLRTADFFEVAVYPTIAFNVVAAHPQGAGKFEITGTLTIRQSTQPITFLANVSVMDDSTTVTAELDIDRSEWGVTWSKMGAGIKNHLVVSARFTKA